MKLRALSVSELNTYIKRNLSYDPILSNVKVVGEIGDFRIPASGHGYFRLVDEGASVACMIFEKDIAPIKEALFDGLSVEVSGHITVYEPRGQYQIQVKEIAPQGAGKVQLEREAMKKRLEKEGLFSEKHKKKLPALPKKIGVITSGTGAAIKDILRVLRRRAPYTEVLLFPVTVQGEKAPSEIVQAFESAGSFSDIDVLILSRGGGASEDLSPFNNEDVVRAVFATGFPVISGVGHEIDWTLCDLVADYRAPTPSAAAEVAAIDWRELLKSLLEKESRLTELIQKRIFEEKKRLEKMKPQYLVENWTKGLEIQKEALNTLESQLFNTMKVFLTGKKVALNYKSRLLHQVSPLGTLKRGYALAENEKGQAIFSVADVQPKTKIAVRFSDGRLLCTVDGKDTCKKEFS